jgi:hypothetical protein
MINLATMKKFKEAISRDRTNIDSFKINSDEMIDNAGPLSDTAFFTKHGTFPMIENSVRVSIVVQGIATSKRFASVSGTFAQYDLKKKTMSRLLRLLENVENSKEAQDILAHEVAILKKKNSQDQVSQAHLTLSGAPTKFKPGSCVNHPLSTSHDTASCTGGKSKSKQPISKTYTKDFTPCSYCKANEGLKARADSHPRENCFFDPTSTKYRPPPKNKGKPSAYAATADTSPVPDVLLSFMTTQTAMNSKMFDSLNALAEAIKSVNSP